MKRRTFLAFLGLAPIIPAAAAIPLPQKNLTFSYFIRRRAGTGRITMEAFKRETSAWYIGADGLLRRTPPFTPTEISLMRNDAAGERK